MHPLLDEETAQFILRGVSINVASCSTERIPSVSRALGCRVSADRRRVTLFLQEQSAATLLSDLRNGGAIAAVFSLPTTHQTLQLKGRRASVAPLAEGDHALLVEYRKAFSAEIVAMGFHDVLALSFLTADHGNVAAVSFEPVSAFVQTPGPNAGRTLQGTPWR